MNEFIQSAAKQLAYYKSVGEKTFAQVKEDELFWCYNEDSNSIAMIVQHIAGNMLSRWTDFLTSDGEKEWRNRDAEFEVVIKTRQELLDKWEEGWSCLFNALDSITENDREKKIFIRSEPHSIIEAINRQLAHVPYHIGQIVYIGKMASNNWSSLTISKGKSSAFNAEKFKNTAK
jgi:hypothetical protein